MGLKLPCLLKNTLLEKQMRDAIEYMANDRAANGKDASVGAIYNDLRNAGIEADLKTVGYLYADTLDLADGHFSSMEHIEEVVGSNFDRTIRNLLLSSKEGEQQIGDLAPSEEVATKLANAFAEAKQEDNRTKSVMKILQEALEKGAKRLVGDLKVKPKEAPKTFVDIIQSALDTETQGFTDLNGQLNGIRKLFAEMQDEVKKISAELKEKGDPTTVQQWENYVKDLEDATYSLLFSKGDAKKAITDMMKESGFAKKLKNGKEILDWNKLAADTHNVNALRDNVENVLLKNGFSPEVASRVKDAMEKEFTDLNANVIEHIVNKGSEVAKEERKKLLDKAGFYKAIETDTKNKIKELETKESAGIITEAEKTKLNNLRDNGQSVGQWMREQNIETIENFHNAVNNEAFQKQYRGALKPLIDSEIAKLFHEYYGDVTNAEAKKAMRDFLGDGTIIEWIKNNGIENKQDLLTKLDDELDKRSISGANKAKVITSFNDTLSEFNDKAKQELINREKALDKEPPIQKTDLHRLAELSNLGIFQSTHDAILHNALGVDGLAQSDMKSLEIVAKKTAALMKEIGANEVDSKKIYASPLFKEFQHEVSQIIKRNRGNRSGMLVAVEVMHNIADLRIAGLLIGFKTGLENLKSNALSLFEMIGSKGFKGQSKHDWNLAMSQYKDTVLRGHPFGKEGDKFGSGVSFTQEMNFTKDFSVGGIGKNIVAALVSFSRVVNNGTDSASKVVRFQKYFKNNIYNALKEYGGLSSDDALKFMNEALYGQSFEDAKVLAEDMLVKYGFPKSKSAINLLANDLVKANLNTGGLITPEIIEAANRSAYKLAGIGIGHERQGGNVLNKWAEAMKQSMTAAQNKSIREQNWNKLAGQRFADLVVWKNLFPFAMGASNWVHLRIQQNLGIGILTGSLDGVRDGRFNWKRSIDFTDQKSIEESMTQRQNARAKIARGTTGLVSTAIVSGILYYAVSGMDDDERDKYLKKLLDHTVLGSYFKKLAPDMLLMYLYHATDAPTGKVISDYMQNQLNIGSDRSIANKTNEIMTKWKRGEWNEGNAIIGQQIGQSFDLPMWRNFKGNYQAIRYWSTGKEPDQYHSPTYFQEGLLAGGVLEELGIFKNNAPIEALAGIGVKTREKFKEHGIERMEDLAQYPEWWNMKTPVTDKKTGVTKDEYIIQQGLDREIAKKQWEQWQQINYVPYMTDTTTAK